MKRTRGGNANNRVLMTSLFSIALLIVVGSCSKRSLRFEVQGEYAARSVREFDSSLVYLSLKHDRVAVLRCGSNTLTGTWDAWDDENSIAEVESRDFFFSFFVEFSGGDRATGLRDGGRDSRLDSVCHCYSENPHVGLYFERQD